MTQTQQLGGKDSAELKLRSLRREWWSATAESLNLEEGSYETRVPFEEEGTSQSELVFVRVRRIRLALWVLEKLQTESGTVIVGVRSSIRMMIKVTAKQTGSHRKQKDVSSLSSSLQLSCSVQYFWNLKVSTWQDGHSDLQKSQNNITKQNLRKGCLEMRVIDGRTKTQ